MQEQPAIAFQRFLAMMKTPDQALQQSPEAMREVLDAFLRNPHEHRAHVDGILGAYLTLWLGYQYPVATRKILGRLFNRRWALIVDQLNTHGEQLAASVQPVELELDFLPRLQADIPAEYKPDDRGIEVVLRSRMDPLRGYEIEAARVLLELPVGATVITTFPDRESIATGTRERSLKEESRIVDTDTHGEETGAELAAGGLKAGGKDTRSRAVEMTTALGGEDRAAVGTWAHKVDSSKIRNRARWHMFASPDQRFGGGFDFRAIARVPAAMTKLDLRALVEVDVVDWGSVPLPLEEAFVFSESKGAWVLDSDSHPQR